MIQQCAQDLLNFLELVLEELPGILSVEWAPVIELTKGFMEKYNKSFNKFKVAAALDLGDLVLKIKNDMQAVRIRKLISARICEYLFLLKKIQSFIVNDVIVKTLGKKVVASFDDFDLKQVRE